MDARQPLYLGVPFSRHHPMLLDNDWPIGIIVMIGLYDILVDVCYGERGFIFIPRPWRTLLDRPTYLQACDVPPWSIIM